MISSVNNSHIQLLKKLLRSSKYRYKYNKIVLEGFHLLDEAFKAGLIERVYISVNSLANVEIKQVLSMVDESKIFLISQLVASSISTLKNSKDLVFTLVGLSINNILPKYEDCIVLDRVQDPGNLGSILRSSLAFGVRNIILSKGCVDIYSSKVLRSAMGAHFYLRLFIDIDLGKFLCEFEGNINFTILCYEDSISLYESSLYGINSWVFGNEGSGIDIGLIRDGYNKIYIPIDNNSLNVSNVVAICLFEQSRQRLLINR